VKIAYILPLGTIVSNKSNGIRMQAAVWADDMRKLGHSVELIDIWSDYNWKSFDIIHIFGIFPDVDDLIRVLSCKTNSVFVYSPIIDTNRPWYLSRLAGWAEFSPLHMTSPWAVLKRAARRPIYFLARSEYERAYIHKALAVSGDRIHKVMLPFRFGAVAEAHQREDFCLHVSILSGPHKNVRRLIDAAIKYKFRLVLAGKCGSVEFQKYLDETREKYSNIKYLGWISDEELRQLYATAKCFALPSLFEGVGLVALEAAASGCGIVVTDRGAPKEYYGGLAHLVNPLSVDAIGQAVCKVLNGDSRQPELMKYVNDNFNKEHLSAILEKAYLDVLSK